MRSVQRSIVFLIMQSQLLYALVLLQTILTNNQQRILSTIQTPIVYADTQSLYASTSPKTASGDTNIDEWLNSLRQCESGGNDKALNPKDSDGTRSVGRFQFKDKTFAYFSKKYDISVTSVWNGDEQEEILRRMIDDPSVNLHNQFPACTKKIGLPQVE